MRTAEGEALMPEFSEQDIGYMLIQAGLHLCGVQSLMKTCEVACIPLERLHILEIELCGIVRGERRRQLAGMTIIPCAKCGVGFERKNGIRGRRPSMCGDCRPLKIRRTLSSDIRKIPMARISKTFSRIPDNPHGKRVKHRGMDPEPYTKVFTEMEDQE